MRIATARHSLILHWQSLPLPRQLNLLLLHRKNLPLNPPLNLLHLHQKTLLLPHRPVVKLSSQKSLLYHLNPRQRQHSSQARPRRTSQRKPRHPKILTRIRNGNALQGKF